jgi:hypothetical protein
MSGGDFTAEPPISRAARLPEVLVANAKAWQSECNDLSA